MEFFCFLPVKVDRTPHGVNIYEFSRHHNFLEGNSREDSITIYKSLKITLMNCCREFKIGKYFVVNSWYSTSSCLLRETDCSPKSVNRGQ
jgi:hypothetical protein